jgi:hypothetical protein
MLSKRDLGSVLYSTRNRVREIEVATVVQHDQFTANDGITLLTSTPTTIATFDSGHNLVSKDIGDIILPTVNQISVQSNGDNTVTLSTPQNIDPTANPIFGGLSLTSTLNATSPSTGALTVQGGMGIANDVYSGGHYYDVNGAVSGRSNGPQYSLQFNGDGLGSFSGSGQYTINDSVATSSQIDVVSPNATITTSIVSDQSGNIGKLATNANAFEMWSQNNKTVSVANGNLTIYPNGGAGSTMTADGYGGLTVQSTNDVALMVAGGAIFGGQLSTYTWGSTDSLMRFATGVDKTYIQSGPQYPTPTFYPIYFTPWATGSPIVYIMGPGGMNINPTTASTSVGTGALMVSGGVGIAKNLYIGGTTVATSTSTGSLVISGGAGVGGAIYIGANIAATSTSTGSLVVTGGAGFGGSIRSGTSIYPGNSNTGFGTYYTDTFTYTPASGTFSGVLLTFKFSRIDDLVFFTFVTAMTTGAGASASFAVTSAQLGTGSGGGTYTARYAPSIGNEVSVTGLIYAAGAYASNTTYFGNAQINVYANVTLGSFNGLSNNGFVHQTVSYRMM